MKTPFPPTIGLSALFLCFGSAEAGALTIAEALGTPGRDWLSTSSPAVTVLEDAALSHDGAGVVRIPIRETTHAAIWTNITVPSVVKFWHRAGGLEDPATLLVNSRAVTSSVWQEFRTVMLPGELRISNDGPSDRTAGALYIDEFSVTPLPTVSLAEALDAPGLNVTATGEGVAGLKDPADAPDGEDAVYLGGSGSYPGMVISAAGLSVMVYRYAPGVAVPDSSRADPVDSPMLGVSTSKPITQWTGLTQGFAGIPSGNNILTLGLRGSSAAWVDQLRILPLVEPAEALDAPGLAFTLTNGPDSASLRTIPSPVGPEGAEGGNALLMESAGDTQGAAQTVLTGAGSLSFQWQGDLVLTVDGVISSLTGTRNTEWESRTFYLGAGNHTVEWAAAGFKKVWLDAVHFLPGVSALAAGLLDHPGAEIDFTVNAALSAVSDASGTGEALQVAWLGPPSAGAAMVVRCEGPCLFSLAAKQDATVGTYPDISVDGGPVCGWAGGFGSGWPQTALIIPQAGSHEVRVVRNGSFDQLGIAPLEEVTLAEALDAPGMTFRTSPATPWLGVKTPASMNLTGNAAACGGSHAGAADPWVETDITGPGLLNFRMELGAKTADAGDEQQAVTLDGTALATPVATGSQRQRILAIPAGIHTVRWTQRGSQVPAASGSQLWLDAVSFQPAVEVSLNEALETDGRTWTIGGAGPVLALAAATAPDGVDAVYFPSGGSWIETTVTLPCQIEAMGAGVEMVAGSGETHLPATPANLWQIEGTGTTTLRVRRSSTPGEGMLALVRIFEVSTNGTVDEVMGVPGVTWRAEGPKTWTFLRNASTGEVRMQMRGGLNAGTSMWLEAVISGPFRIQPELISDPVMVAEISLPDQDGRIILPPAFITSVGPQRVRIRLNTPGFAAPALFTVVSAGYRPGLPPGPQTGVQGLTWTTGGDAPWTGTSEGAAGAVCGPVKTGEVSWLETEITGPAIASWKTGALHPAGKTGLVEVQTDGMRIPYAADMWLHLSAGAHRIRWSVYGTAQAGEFLTHQMLSELRITPKRAGSVQEILSAPDLIFAQKAARGTSAGAPLREWPEGSPWFPATDAATGRTALRTFGAPFGAVDARNDPFRVLRPVPGRVLSTLKTDEFGYVSRTSPEFPVAALPFPWSPARQTPVHTASHAWYLKAGPGLADYWLDDVSLVPIQAVPVGEALDQPGLAWTSGGSRPGLIGGWTGPAAREDSVIARDMSPLEEACVEAPVTGPAVITWKRTDALRLNVLVDGQQVLQFAGRGNAPSLYPIDDRLHLGNGTHIVRWRFSRDSPNQDSMGSLDAVTITPSAAQPDLTALLDDPGLRWNLTPATAKLSSSITHDGQAALEIVPVIIPPATSAAKWTLSTEVTGPGIFRCWFRGGAASMRSVQEDNFIIMSGTSSGESWKEFAAPVPAGTYRFTLAGQGGAWVDGALWTPLTPLSIAEGLDAPTGITLTPVRGSESVAAAWSDFAWDTEDSVMMMPGLSHHIKVKIPAGSTLFLRAKSLNSDGVIVCGASELRTSLRTNAWTEVLFPVTAFPDTDGVVVRASSSGPPILIDHLAVIPPGATPYVAWAAIEGLAGHPAGGPTQDADGDGLSNLLEFAFGLAPLEPYRPGTTAGLPVVSLVPRPGKTPTLGVEFQFVKGLKYVVETSVDPVAGPWTAVLTVTPSTAGKRYWESPAGIEARPRLFARVRVSMP